MGCSSIAVSVSANLAAAPDALTNWSRSRRVTVLVLGVIVLSLADLIVTLAYLRANWMMEANPIAEFLIRYTQSPWTLAAYKALTVGVCVALLYRVRHHLAGEIAAWCAVGILAGMCVMWHSYAAHLTQGGDLILTQAVVFDDQRLGLN